MYNSSCWLFPAQFGEVRCSSKQRLGCFVIRIICTRNGPNSLSSTSHLSWSINSIAFLGNCFQSPCLSEFLHEIINGKTVIFLVKDRCDSSLTIDTMIFQVQDRCDSILIIHTIIFLVQDRCDSSLTIHTFIFLVQNRCDSNLSIHTIIFLVQVRCDSNKCRNQLPWTFYSGPARREWARLNIRHSEHFCLFPSVAGILNNGKIFSNFRYSTNSVWPPRRNLKIMHLNYTLMVPHFFVLCAGCHCHKM